MRRHTGPEPRLDGVIHRLGIVENLNCTLDLHYTWHSPVDLARLSAPQSLDSVGYGRLTPPAYPRFHTYPAQAVNTLAA